MQQAIQLCIDCVYLQEDQKKNYYKCTVIAYTMTITSFLIIAGSGSEKSSSVHNIDKSIVYLRKARRSPKYALIKVYLTKKTIVIADRNYYLIKAYS